MTKEEEINKLYQDYIDRGKRDPYIGPASWIIMDRLIDVVLTYVHGPVVEIGVGHSTLVLAKHAQQFGVPFLTCDIRPKKCDWVRAVVKYDKLTVFNGKSFDFMKQYSLPNASVVFIDGDHHYDVLKVEVDFFLARLLVGGVMFLHDTCPVQFRFEKHKLKGKNIDTWRARKDLEKMDNVDVLTWRYTAAECGLTMVLKKDMSLPEYRS